MLCLICNKEIPYKSMKDFTGIHLKKHNITSKEYYDKYYKKEDEGKCKLCGGDTQFTNLSLKNKSPYLDYCSRKCSANDPDKIKRLIESKGQIIQFEKIRIKLNQSTVVCKLCDKKQLNIRSLTQHIINHHRDYSLQQYYDLFLKKNSEEGKCETCHSNTRFTGLRGYVRHCNIQCALKNKNVLRKALKTKIKNGYCINESEKLSFEYYSFIVRLETKKHIKLLFKNWDGFDYYTKEKLITNKEFRQVNPGIHTSLNPLQPTVDHRISIFEGFKKKMNPFKIGHINNLCICSRKLNIDKGIKVNENRDETE